MKRRVRNLSVTAALAGLLLASCVRERPAELPAAPQPYGTIRIAAAPVELDASNPGPRRLGALTFLWGARLTSPTTSRFTDLSGLEVRADGDALQFLAVTDSGDLMRWQAPAAGAGRFATVDAEFAALRGLDGVVLPNKAAADSEDLSLDDDGLFVAFEGDHRVWRYAPLGGPLPALRPTPAPAWPRVRMRPNRGFEAMSVLRRADGDRLAVGAEDGRAWLCPLREAGDCRPLLTGREIPGYALTGFDQLDGTEDLVAVYRAYDVFGGMRSIVARVSTSPDAAGRPHVTELARIERPLAHANFEAVAALPNGRGGWTLWLVSDNGFPPDSPALLFAFDYTPEGASGSDAPVR